MPDMKERVMRMLRRPDATRSQSVTPLGAIARGLVAGAVGTLAMDTLWYIRYRRDDGKSAFRRWEFSSDILSWEQAPAPAHVGKRLYEGLFRRELPDHRAALVSNVMHWGYGILNAVPYAVLVGSVPDPKVRFGAPFGAGVWHRTPGCGPAPRWEGGGGPPAPSSSQPRACKSRSGSTTHGSSPRISAR